MLIETKRCVIRNMAIGDAESLYEVLSDPQAMAYVEPPFSMERTQAFLQEAGMSEPPLVYAVCSKADSRMIGHLIFHPYEGGIYELGWILNRRYWRRGIASELTGAVIEYARQPGDFVYCDRMLPKAAGIHRHSGKSRLFLLRRSGRLQHIFAKAYLNATILSMSPYRAFTKNKNFA